MLPSDVSLRPVSDRHARRGTLGPSPPMSPPSLLVRVRTRSVGQHSAHVGLGRCYAVNPCVAMKPPHGLAPPDRAHVIFNGIAGHPRLAKIATVESETVTRPPP